jgi:hypothetical protein
MGVDIRNDRFRLLAADHTDVPDLATQAGQRMLDPLLDGADLLVIDNVSTLCWTGSDNSAGSWTSVQEWILRLRKRGLAVLLVHHSGKSGEQRGTSRREDVLDTVIGLRRPEDYEPQQGARFEVHVEKSRAHFGDAGRPFEASLASTPDGRGLTWLACDLKPSHLEEAVALFRSGVTVRAVAAQRTNFDLRTAANIAAVGSFFEGLQLQWGLNLSFENANGTAALRAGYDYWLRAADRQAKLCSPTFKVHAGPATSPCLSVIRVTSANAPFEPQGFIRGTAVCSMSTEASAFYKSCSFMTFEGSGGKLYVKAVVGPPMGMGGGAFVDDFGAFNIACSLPQSNRTEKLLKIKTAFGLEGTYNLGSEIEVEAETGFEYFPDAQRWGPHTRKRIVKRCVWLSRN